VLQFRQLMTSPASQLVYGILQGLASLERGILRCGDRDGIARARIAAGTCATLADREGAEANQRDRVAFLQRLGDGSDHRVDRTRCLDLGQFRGVGDGKIGALVARGVLVVAALEVVLWFARFSGFLAGPVPV
jgi:hypothetical protein